jgi:hypothetical protein
MSCCGSQRAALRQGAVSGGNGSPAYHMGALEFEYTGGGNLRIVGPMTGAIYTFAGAGARAVVQAADAPSLAMYAGLKPVR